MDVLLKENIDALVSKVRNDRIMCRWGVPVKLPKKREHTLAVDHQSALSSVAYVCGCGVGSQQICRNYVFDVSCCAHVDEPYAIIFLELLRVAQQNIYSFFECHIVPQSRVQYIRHHGNIYRVSWRNRLPLNPKRIAQALWF